LVTIFSNSSAELELISDQSGTFGLVFGLSQKAQPRTKRKSEVTQCRKLKRAERLRSSIFKTKVDVGATSSLAVPQICRSVYVDKANGEREPESVRQHTGRYPATCPQTEESMN